MASIKGKAVPLYRSGTPYLDNLRAVLERDDIKDLPIVTLSVTGEFRTGKSFLLSYFLRYLKNQNSSYKLGDEKDELVGFTHKNDTQAVTRGVEIWNQPLIVKATKEDGLEQKVVVLLMDSEGLYGDEEQKKVIRTFVFTALISSLMIFNVKGQLNANVIQNLKQFTNYVEGSSEESRDYKIFQNLMLLIRDWGNPGIHKLGSEGGNDYLKTKSSVSDEFGVWFSNIECYLMPRPGDCVEKLDFNGEHKDFRKDFKDSLKNLMDRLLGPKQLLKYQMRIAGHPITAGDFCKKVKQVNDDLEKVNWDQPASVIECLQLTRAKDEALKVFRSNIEKIVSSFYKEDTKEFMGREILQQNVNSAVSESHGKYRDLLPSDRKRGKDLIREDKESVYEAFGDHFKSSKAEMKEKIEEVYNLLNCVKAAGAGVAAVAVGAVGVVTDIGAAMPEGFFVVEALSTALAGVSAVGMASLATAAGGISAAVGGVGYLCYKDYSKDKLKEMVESILINDTLLTIQEKEEKMKKKRLVQRVGSLRS